MLLAKLLPRKVFDHYSRVLVLTSFVVLLVLVFFPSMIKSNFFSSERPTRVEVVKCFTVIHPTVLNTGNHTEARRKKNGEGG
jgi:hypothetical protein